jgi:hypothetical protein
MKIKEIPPEDNLSLALGEYIEYCDGIKEIQFREMISAAFKTYYVPRIPFWIKLKKYEILDSSNYYFLDEMNEKISK